MIVTKNVIVYQFWSCYSGNNHRKPFRDFLLLFTSSRCTKNKMLNELLDTRLSHPTRHQEHEIILVLNKTFACLCSNPKSRSSILTYSRVCAPIPNLAHLCLLYLKRFYKLQGRWLRSLYIPLQLKKFVNFVNSTNFPTHIKPLMYC